MKPKSNAFLASALRPALMASLVLCASAIPAAAVTFLWDGEGADNKFSTDANWDMDLPVAINSNDIRFGASPQNTALVDVGGNFNTLFFNPAAPAMTISSDPAKNGMQFATGAATQIQNDSPFVQTFNTVLREFWITGSATRSWSAAAGDLVYQNILFRPDSSVANNVTLNFTGNFSHTVNGPINLEGSWTGKTASIAKSGSGTLTLLGGGNYNGTTSANGGNLVLDLVGGLNIPATSPLSLGGGTFTLKGAPAGTSAQTVASIAGSSGNVVINPNGGSGTTLTITSATVPASTTVNFDTSAGTPSTAVVAWDPVLTDGIIGAGFTIKDNAGIGLATVIGGNVTRLTSTVLTASNPTNSATDFLENSSVTNTVADAQLGSLFVDTTSGALTWNLGAANSATISTGVISVIGGNDYTISNGTLKSNSDLKLQNGGTGTFTINSPIVDGIGASSLTKSGPGNVVLTGARTFTGATNALGGTLVLSGSSTASEVAIKGGNGTIVRVTAIGAAGNGQLKFNTGSANGVMQLHIDGGGTIALPNGLGGNSGVTGNIDVDNNGDGSTGGVIQLNASSGSTAIGAMTFNVTGSNGYSLFIANLRSTAGAGGAVNFNPTSASLTLGNLTGSVAGKISTWTLLGTNADNAVTGVISNGNATAISSVQKSNSSTWTLFGANTYTGKSQVFNGTLNVSSLNSVVGGSASSSLGAPTDPLYTTIDLGSAGATGVLNYTGSGETTDRVINLNGGVGGAEIRQSGTGLLKFSSNFTATGAGGKTLTLSGSSAGTGEVSGAIVNSTGNTALTKAGSGTWTLSGPNSYTGALKVNEGILNLTGNRTVNIGGINVGNPSATTVTLNVSNGAFGTGSFLVGQGADNTAIGVVNQTGGTLTTGGNQLLVGNGSSKGIYNLSAGTLNTIAGNLGVVVGVNNGTNAEFNLSGTGNLSMAATSTLQITRSDGSAASNITGVFNQTGGTATVGILRMGGSTTNSVNNAGQNATLNLTGGTFSAVTFNQLSGGDGSVSSIVIGGNASVSLPAFPTARGAAATATVTFDGGTLSPVAADAAYIGGLDHAYLTANGAKINVATGNDITISQNLENAPSQTGKLIKQGSGTLTLTGGTSYSGATTVQDGVLSAESGNFSDTAALTIGIIAASPAVLNLPNAGTDTVGSLIIDGVTQVAGIYDSGNSGGAITGLGKIQVGAGVASYATYAAAFTSPPLSNTASNADPDFDGVANVVEYVTGSDPRFASSASRPSSSVSGGNLLFQFNRVDSSETPDVALVVETSTNLVDWATQPSFTIGANNAGSSLGVNIVENGAAADTITVTISGGAKKFARLRVVTTP